MSSSTSTWMYTGDWHSATRSYISGCAATSSDTSGSSSEYSSSSRSRSDSGVSRKPSRISASASGTSLALIPVIVPRSDGSRLGAGDDRHPNGAAPLRPGTVVVAHVLEAEQVLEHEPGVARALTDAAVC